MPMMLTGQVADGAGLLQGAGQRLVANRFDLFLQQIDHVLGGLQPPRRQRPAPARELVEDIQ